MVGGLKEPLEIMESNPHAKASSPRAGCVGMLAGFF